MSVPTGQVLTDNTGKVGIVDDNTGDRRGVIPPADMMRSEAKND